MRQLRIEVRGMSAHYMNIKECMNVEVEADGKPWYHDIKAYIKDGEYSPRATDSEKNFIRHMACQFFLSREVLYQRNHDTTLLQCIDTPVGPKDYESRLLLAHHGKLLHQACKDVPPLPGLSK